MPVPKETPIIEEPTVIAEIRASEKKRRPTAQSQSHMRGSSFMSIVSRKASRFSLISRGKSIIEDN